MQIVTKGVAGTMESSDISVRIEPREGEGITLTLTSAVMQQFGKQIEAVIRGTLASLGVTSAVVDAVDKGALDCTVEARVKTAAYRAAKCEAYVWENRK
ncbi:MAG: Citrate lyase acyl carrier protein [Firmicutes bacterium ADurb.Bin248]|nr:MAG: Citrate lyase acyl carrier protein [Firmicutes bacterium ADurb.Bin248]HOF99515.1 citrate lyase acyl carrier protein [Clostridia bacterium]HPK15053.1 citrate lyase acyl carrier protein [Clostridia bacterium]